MEINQYNKLIKEGVAKDYKLAEAARAKGFDPNIKVEIPLAETLAEKVVGLISTMYPQVEDPKVVNRILELEEEYGLSDFAVAFKIAEEIAKEKYCKFKDHEEAVDAGIRIGFAYITFGVVSSPLEGFTHWEKKKRKDNDKDYMCLFYSGPIRSAGGTNGTVSILIGDHIREVLGYEKYDPTDIEIKRVVSEVLDYHDRITNLQYVPSVKELEFMVKHVPVQIDGLPSEDKEVYNYKDLPRIDTNFIRNGVALILGEGLAQKAHKVLKIRNGLRSNGIKLSDWDWLDDFVALKDEEQKKKKSEGASATYISDIVAGRPVVGHPSKGGGFRLRYGKCRTSGLSSMAMNRLSMGVLNRYVGFGTQLKYEGPGKSSAMSLCDDLEGPIVKLENGTVVKFDSDENVERYKNEIEEVLFLGDFLVNYAEFFNRGKHFDKPGYVEEWYARELEAKVKELGENPPTHPKPNNSPPTRNLDARNPTDKLRQTAKAIIDNWRTEVSFEEAVSIGQEFGMSLHPKFIYYWDQIDYELFLGLVDWISTGEVKEGKLILPYTETDRERYVKGKRALELIGCVHDITLENVVLKEQERKALLFNLGVSENIEEMNKKVRIILKERNLAVSSVANFANGIIQNSLKEIGEKETLEIINELCTLRIRDKSGTWIGARMGRPEKAKLRKLTGSPHVLFPVGEQGGRLRSFQAALEEGYVKAEFPGYHCETCALDRVYAKCEICGEQCKKVENEGKEYVERKIDIKEHFDLAKKKVSVSGDEVPLLKGVRGTSSIDHTCENLAKGFLRAKHGLNVNKDGTIRYDVTEMPLTHFKPKEIGTSAEKLREMGYEKDKDGKKLESDEQLVELMPQDILLPACVESQDEKADDVFIGIAKYMDDLLEKFYGLERYYNISKREELVGHLVLGLAPHTSAGIVGRIIGFSKSQACVAHPMWHAAQRRDCEGDETCVMLLLDALINFSRKYLPAHRGATQDAPLVASSKLTAAEIDDMAFDIDVVWKYPLELYEAAEQKKEPWDIKIEQLDNRLGTDGAYKDFGFTHEVENINNSIMCSDYKLLPTMDEKVAGQMWIAEKLRSVNTSDVARLVIEKHFIRDTRGNLRKFSMQVFRCVGCNNKYRRVPLTGKCGKCGGRLIFTIAEGSVLKYLEKSLNLAKKYEVSPYLLESLELTEMYIESIFGKETEKQEAIDKWF